MDFPTTVNVYLRYEGTENDQSKSITVHGGITTLLGPNGSGKTQLLRGLKQNLVNHASGKKIRYVSAGRLGPLETFRSDFDGQRGGTPMYEEAQYGDKRSMVRRHLNETAVGDFATLAERPDILIKVRERLSKLFNRDVRLDWDGGYLKVYFTRNDVISKEYSSAREASGLLHMVSILASLYDDEVGVLLIDEPEVSLHPQLQSFLYQEISKVAGSPDQAGKKLVFLSTHSTEFVNLQSVDELASIVFCSDVYKMPVQIDPSIDEFRGRKIEALLARMGQEHKLALFCDRPLLVEGPSDQIICSGLSRILNLNIEAAGSQVLPVIGKGQMPIVIKLMRMIGKSPSVIADTDALSDGLDLVSSFIVDQPLANSIATELGHRNASVFARSVYNDFSQCVNDNWEDISSFVECHPYWIHRDVAKDEVIYKRRAAMCFLLSSAELSDINNHQAWSDIRQRLDSLLDLLNKLGCFILRKGTIEAYYLNANQLTSDEKPNAAAHEVAFMSDVSNGVLLENYKDIIDAIKFASQAKSINESEAIREIVLAVVAPSLAKLNESTTDIELNTDCRSLLGNKADLFNLSQEKSDKHYLTVDLVSDVLEIEGFPLRIAKDSNIITTINEQMGFS